MAFRAIYDFVFHAESFRNIDLFYQGLYHVKIVLYYENAGQVGFPIIQKIYAHPYTNTSALWPMGEAKSSEGGQLFKESQIEDDESHFATKTFLIKFCEEEVEINDFCHFRVEVDTQPNFEDIEFYLEASLHFHDCNNPGNDANKGNSVAISKIKIKKAFYGFSEYIPLIFYEQNFSILNSTIHAMGIDFHHRLHTLHLSQFVQKLKEPKYNNDSSLLLEELLNKGEPIDFLTYLKEKYKGKTINSSFLRLEFTRKLEMNFESLMENYEKVYSKCIDDKQRKQFSKQLTLPQKLIIPEYMKAAEENFRDAEDPELLYAYIFSV